MVEHVRCFEAARAHDVQLAFEGLVHHARARGLVVLERGLEVVQELEFAQRLAVVVVLPPLSLGLADGLVRRRLVLRSVDRCSWYCDFVLMSGARARSLASAAAASSSLDGFRLLRTSAPTSLACSIRSIITRICSSSASRFESFSRVAALTMVLCCWNWLSPVTGAAQRAAILSLVASPQCRIGSSVN